MEEHYTRVCNTLKSVCMLLPNVLLVGHDALDWFVCPSRLLVQSFLHSVCSQSSCHDCCLSKFITLHETLGRSTCSQFKLYTSQRYNELFWPNLLSLNVFPPLLLFQSKAVFCPMSGRPLKMSDLITVRFTPLDPSLDRVALLTRQVRSKPLWSPTFSSISPEPHLSVPI